MIEKQELLTELLISSISKTKVGIIVRGIRGINPNKVIDQVLRAVNTPLFVSSVGYPRAQIYENETGILSDRIEDAVKWRSDPEYSWKIVAFVNEETDKLHSLAEFDVITPRSLSQWLLTNQIDKAQNEPTRNFWEALRVQSDQYTLDALIDFVEAVQTSSDVQKAIPANMWRIGLLSDPTILTTKSTPQDKLGKNRELLLKTGLLTYDSRKKMTSSLAMI